MPDKKALLAGRVISNREIVKGHLVMTIRLPRAFGEPLPGQFVMLRVKERGDLLLGRPFSVYDFQPGARSVTLGILYRVAGEGTAALSRRRQGDWVEILGPLGRPFDLSRRPANIVLVAGGIGIAPIRFLLEHLAKGRAEGRPRISLYAGAKSASELIGLEGMEPFCQDVNVCTDDCSRGHRGLVTEPLEKNLRSIAAADTMMYACGPVGMIRELAALLRDHPVPCQVSLEERMACGLGACLGCAVAVRGPDGGRQYKRVCREGPVFDIRDMLWDEGFEVT
jgi:dihydroorotate dehydrogenase electron transfer subunit